MGIDVTFGKAYAKAAIAAGQRLPQSGNVFITMMDKYKDAAVPIAQDLQALGFGILATYNTAAHLRAAGLKDVQSVLKVQEGRPNAGARAGWGVGGWAWEGGRLFRLGGWLPRAARPATRHVPRLPALLTLRFAFYPCSHTASAFFLRLPLLPACLPARPPEDLMKNGDI